MNNFSPMSSRFNQSPNFKRKRFARKSRSFHNFGKNFFNRNDRVIEFPSFDLIGGNRQDPLNLRPFIDPEPMSNSTDSGKDHLVEILLPPNIYDPLCLDSSSKNRLDYSPMIEYNSSQMVQTTPCPSRYRPRHQRRSQQVSEWIR